MPSVNISEHTDRPDFINLLKEKLGLKFRVFQEVNYIDERGNRYQVDIVVFDAEKIEVDLNSGTLNWTSEDAIISIIETKIKRKDQLESHEPQLFDYLKVLKCNIGFITNYRLIVSYLMNSDFSDYEKHIYDDNLENISYFIADIIEKVSQIRIQKSPEEIINLLESAIEDLTKFTGKISGDEWETNLRFSDASEIQEKKKELSKKELEDRERFLQRSAAYFAIAQLLFYVTFRQYRIDENINENPKLAPLSKANGIPTQLQELLEEVPNNNLNFRAIFGKNKEVFSHLDDDAAPILKSIINMLEGISAKFVIENDLIGQIFQRLMPYETRKKFAAYYTLNNAAELLCRISITNMEDTIYDPACGSGTLLVNAYKRKRELGLNQHKKLLEQIRGSDISDIATMMSTINLAIQDPSKWTNHVNILPYDAIDLSYGMTRFQHHSIESPDGRIDVDAEIMYKLFEPVDVLLANPPFTRGARLSQNQRNKLKNLYYVKEYKYKPNFKAVNFYAFFLFIAPQLVKKEKGKIAFILPQGAINSKAMIEVWNTLFKIGFGIITIIESSDLDESFSDSEDHEIMVVLEKGYKNKVKLIKLFGYLEKKHIPNLVDKMESIKTPFEKNEDFVIQIKEQSDIQDVPCMEWNLYPSQTMLLAYQKYIPLDLSYLSEKQKELYRKDLSSFITIITENAARPVDYWFIPNKYWSIQEENEDHFILNATSDNIVVAKSEKEQTMILPKDAFIPAISSSVKNYADYPPIIPENLIDNYFLIDESRKDMKQYYNWGVKGHEEELFGTSHSTYTPVKNSGGIVKRLNFANSKTLALRFKTPMMGRRCISFGFYSDDQINSDLFFAYLTSSLFLLDAIEKSRKRSAEFVIMYQVDFQRKFKFPDIELIRKDDALCSEILDSSNEYNNNIPLKDRPIIPELIRQVRMDKNHPLRKLDVTWFKALDLPISYLDIMYREIEERLADIIQKFHIDT